MTVEITYPSVGYQYNGPGDYDFDFLIYDEATIYVTYTSEAGDPKEWLNGTDFTVSIASGVDGGTVAILDTVDTQVTGGSINIRRVLPIEQQVDWVNGDPMDMEVLEQSFDELTMMVQQIEVTVSDGSATSSWRGDWAPSTLYYPKDMVVGPDINWYYCITQHISTTDFPTDLAAGVWTLALDVQALEELVGQAAASAVEAGASADAAAASAAAALASQTAASASAAAAANYEANSAINAQNAANCAQEAYDEAERAEEAAATIDTDLLVKQDSDTGAASIPTGTLAEQPAGVAGNFRFNTDTPGFEGHDGTEWGPIGGGGPQVPVAAQKNLLINGGFSIYQRETDLTLTADQYGPDRWKGGAAGCTYTIADGVVTIAAGSLVQVVEDVNVPDGDAILSNSGTATGTIDGVSETATLVKGVSVYVEFGIGTVDRAQLELGDTATDFEYRSYGEELALCQRYYQNDLELIFSGYITNGDSFYCSALLPVEMRVEPTVELIPRGSSAGFGITPSLNNITTKFIILADTATQALGGAYYLVGCSLDAEL